MTAAPVLRDAAGIGRLIHLTSPVTAVTAHSHRALVVPDGVDYNPMIAAAVHLAGSSFPVVQVRGARVAGHTGYDAQVLAGDVVTLIGAHLECCPIDGSLEILVEALYRHTSQDGAQLLRRLNDHQGG